MTLFWIYVVIQLVSTAYGVTVINSVKKVPLIKKRLHDAGYTKRDRNSLYDFSDGIVYFFKGFIPFYYAYKAIQLINDEDPIGRLANEEIEKGNYISKQDERIFREEEERAQGSVANDPNALYYQTVEKYSARKNNFNEIYDTDETPLEYITREAMKSTDVKITPFIEVNTKPIDVVSEPKQPEVIEIKDENKEETVSKSAIAKAIAELDVSELNELSEKLKALAEIKKTNN